MVKIVFFGIALLYISMMVYQMSLIVHFKIHQEEITAQFCVNKDKPEMHCNGHCHLQKELATTQAVVSSTDQVDTSSQRTPEISVSFFMGIGELEYSKVLIDTLSIEVACDSPTKSTSCGVDSAIWSPPRA